MAIMAKPIMVDVIEKRTLSMIYTPRLCELMNGDYALSARLSNLANALVQNPLGMAFSVNTFH